MKSKLPLLALALPAVALAGTNYFKVSEGGNDSVGVNAVDAIATDEVVKFKAELTNKTGGYLLFDANKALFHVSGQDITTESDAWKGFLIVGPGGSDSKVLDAVGSGLEVDAFTVTLGGFSLADAEGEGVAVADFRLPSAGDTFDTGGFNCALGKVKKETKETSGAFKCTWQGEGLAIVRPDRINLRVEGVEQKWNNDAKPKTHLLLPGMDFKVAFEFHVPARDADMQFATMWVEFGDAFAVSAISPADPVELAFELDPGLTEGKN